MRGKGYASEALRALLELARAAGVASVKGDADLDNVASQHVMAAAGMRFIGEDDRLRYFRIDWTAGSEAAGEGGATATEGATGSDPSPQVSARRPS